MHDSVRLLAIAREQFVRDADGREAATAALLEQFKEACRKAGLILTTDKGVDHVSLFNPPRVKVPIGVYSDPVQTVLEKIEYDPVKKQYFATEPDGPEPLRTLTSHIAGLLIEQTSKAMK